jgi:hypothetical protein
MDISGYIYIITSPSLNGMRIGKSTCDAPEIYSKNTDPYGGKMTIATYKSNDRHYHKKKIQFLLKEHHVGGDIFALDAYEHAKNICVEICNNSGSEIIYD